MIKSIIVNLGSLNLLKRQILLLAFSIVIGTAHSQSVSNHISNLESAETTDSFKKSFSEMMSDFHAGKLSFRNDDVDRVLVIARAKPFKNDVLANVYAWVGSMYGDGRMAEALMFFLEGAEEHKKEKNQYGEALCFMEIALIQHKAENYGESEEYYRLALEIGSSVLPHRTIISCHNGLALIQRERGDCDAAIIEFRKAVQIARVNDDVAWQGILLGNIGSCHLKSGSYDSSLFYYKKNLAFIRKTNEFENEIETYAHLARVLFELKEYSKSKLYLDSALAIIQGRKIFFNDFFNPMDYIHETYSKIYAATNNFKLAHEHLLEFHRIADEKQKKINGRSLKQLQSAYEYRKNQNEIKFLKQINDTNTTVIRQQTFITWALALIILLMAGILIFAFRSVKRRKRINKQLTQSNTELERLNEVKNMLFSVISHDLRAPMATLRSTLSLMKGENLTKAELAMISEKLGQQVEVSGNALENILQWAKAQLSDMEVTPVEINVSALVNSVLSQLATEIEQKKITVTNTVHADQHIYADKDQIEVVVRNVISNSVKFTPAHGTIQIFDRAERNFVTLVIEDSGVGMNQEQLDRLFKPGKHSTTPGTNKEKGTGIGLIISKEMIANNGGTITVESRPGKGSKFMLIVPSGNKTIGHF